MKMPTLERTMSVEENSDDDSAMPSLNPSVLPDDSAYAYDTALDDDTTVLSVVDMHTTTDELSDIDDHGLPVLNSTAFGETYYSFKIFSAVWLAVRDVFPGKEMKGCAFHWSQAVWRHVQSVGLAETYRRRVGVFNYVRMLLALQFLPASHIRRAFEKLAETATTEATRALTSYIERQWMRNPIFAVEDWSVFRQTIRTNNDVDGWHNRLNQKAGGSGLGFYRHVPVLRREAELVQMSVESEDLERGGNVRCLRQDNTIRTLADEYLNGDMRISEYLGRTGDVYRLRM